MKTPKPDPTGPSTAYTVKALVKALRILECLAEDDQPSYTLTELSRRLHLHVSTVHRLMVNLVRQGFVELDPASGGYQLGFQVLRMGLRVLDRLDYRRVAHPLLRELNQKTQETVHLAILQGDQAISIEKFGSPQPVALDARLGGQMPLHCTGVGKVLLAYQSEEMLTKLAKSPGLERFTPRTVTTLPMEKHDEALSRGFAGMRVSGNPYWIDNKKDWDDFACYEAEINNVIGGTKLLVLCTYSLQKCGVPEILDVVKNHEFALAMSHGAWQLVSMPAFSHSHLS